MKNEYWIVMPFEKVPTATSQQKGEMVRNGRVVHFKKKNVREAEEILEYRLRNWKKLNELETISGPVRMKINWEFPTKDKKKIYTPKVTRPDLDNMAKLLIDCIVRTGILQDDSIIFELMLEKSWTREGDGVIEVYIQEVTDEDAYLF